MRILIVDRCVIPVIKYGGTERVIWSLGKNLQELGHKVTFLVRPGSWCHFAQVKLIKDEINIVDEITEDFDIVHLNFIPDRLETIRIPYVFTMHGNNYTNKFFDFNTIFVSKSHASNYKSTSYVHNGLDWDELDTPDFTKQREHFHFLGKASWKVKNVKGAIDSVLANPAEKIVVMGGKRWHKRNGVKNNFSSRVDYLGMVGGEEKNKVLNKSKGLVFPVLWEEPFGLAIIESLYYGCPVFGTTYGSLPELVNSDVGRLSNDMNELANYISESNSYPPLTCHEYARDIHNARNMAIEYLEKYELVLNGYQLNDSAPQYIGNPSQLKILPWKD